MTQFCIIGFNRIGIVFALRDFISAIVIPQARIGIKTITEIPFGLWSIVYHELDRCLGSLPDHDPTQNATRFSVNNSDYVDRVFLSPINVNNSSISAFSTFPGTGASGSFSAWAFAQFATLW